MLQKISEVRSQLQKSLTGLRWVAPENLHLTLKFLGSVDENGVTPMMHALENALRPIPCSLIGAKGIGVFPNIRRARVLWIGLEGHGLFQLADAVETALEPLGFSREKRDFAPHLTLARWRNPGLQPEKLKEQLSIWQNHDFGKSRVYNVVLFQSVLMPKGAAYTSLGEIPLKEQ